MYGEGPMPRDIPQDNKKTGKKDVAMQIDFLLYSTKRENLIATVTMAPTKAPPHTDSQLPTTSMPKTPSSEMEECLGANCYDTMKRKLKYKGVTETRHMNWFRATLEYERCLQLDMP